ncbi:unnamed protein product [Paramecium octaurelia]|uniref:Uncharacterized protein n=1 Tax=Paramecium octaurelia TaxID=43137 RepID=A0A8S1SBA9_PAROT|nr:unnamed protein product [Paramecium octaurelia]
MNQCRIKHHDCQKVKYICLDKKCNHEQKIGCADCFLEFHVPNDLVSHQRKLISEFEAELKGKIENLSTISIQSIHNNSEQVDKQFDTCMNNLIQKLTDYKDQIKEEIKNEKMDFVTYVNEFNQKVEQKIDLQNTQISQLSTNEINKSISFYQNSNNIVLDLRKDLSDLELHKKKLNLKKQKAVQKLRNTFEQIMKELDDHSNGCNNNNSNSNNNNNNNNNSNNNSINNSNNNNNNKKNSNNNNHNNISCTPEKQIYPSQLSNTTQSTPTKNVVDVARSKKQRKGKN